MKSEIELEKTIQIFVYDNYPIQKEIKDALRQTKIFSPDNVETKKEGIHK